MKNIFLNPLITKQMREESRSRKIFFLVPVYIAVLSIVALIAIGSTNQGSTTNPSMLSNSAHFTMFSFVITMSILLGLISIVFGAASFTGEREKGTYELLELTPLTYGELVLGKFFHAFLLLTLILLSSMPVLSTLLFMGGLSIVDVFLCFFYLLVFLSVVTLASICLSIVSKRTILSIILSLALGFIVSVTISIASAAASRRPEMLGFSIISPWLVSYLQIFSPAKLNFGGIQVPVWPYYLGIYFLAALLLLSWGRNALDTRKLKRNYTARFFSLLLVNVYVAVGILCLRSAGPITPGFLEDFYASIMFVLIFVLPCFAVGIFNDREYARFVKSPLIETFNLKKLFLNYPPTAVPFLIFLLLTVTLNVAISGGVHYQSLAPFLALYLLWVVPWLFIFLALRLNGFGSRGLIISYVLGTLLLTLISIFRTAKVPPKTVFDFFLNTPTVIAFLSLSFLFFVISYFRARKRKITMAPAL